jgi:hypothetical protein
MHGPLNVKFANAKRVKFYFTQTLLSVTTFYSRGMPPRIISVLTRYALIISITTLPQCSYAVIGTKYMEGGGGAEFLQTWYRI